MGEQLGGGSWQGGGGRTDSLLVDSFSLVFSSLHYVIPGVQFSVLDKESIDSKVLDTK